MYPEKYPEKSLAGNGFAWAWIGKKKPANLCGMRVSEDFSRLLWTAVCRYLADRGGF
jgi:hypothetical protein